MCACPILDADLGETAVSAVSTGDGEFTLTDQTIGISGAWEVALVVQRPDAFDARTAFRFETTGDGGASAITPSKDTAYIMLGAIFGVLGLMFLVSSLRFGGFQTHSGAAAMTLGVVGMIGAAALLAGVLGSEQGVPERNPIPATSDSVAAGLSLYDIHCQLCHGTEGLGDGTRVRGPESSCGRPHSPCAASTLTAPFSTSSTTAYRTPRCPRSAKHSQTTRYGIWSTTFGHWSKSVLPSVETLPSRINELDNAVCGCE